MVGRLLVVAMVSALGCSEDNRCEVDLEKYATTCPQTFDGTPAALPVCMDESLIYDFEFEDGDGLANLT